MSQTASIYIGKSGGDIWVACPSCDKVTSHEILRRVDTRDESPDGDIRIWEDFMIIKCRGCCTVTFCIESSNTEETNWDPETNSEFLVKKHRLYPPRVAGRTEMESIYILPFGIYGVYKESHAALCSDQPILAGIGIRAIVEAICKEKGIPGRTLEKRIDGLVTKGIVTQAGADILHNLRFMGNNAAHEIKAHSIEELTTAWGVVEHLLQGVYIIPKQAAKLPKQKR